MRVAAIVVIAFALVFGGCSTVGSSTSVSPTKTSPPTTDACALAAVAYAGRVAGSFVTTIGAIHAMALIAHDPNLRPGLADDRAAVLCHIDGQIAKAPPPPAVGTTPPSFDRAVVVVIDGQADLIAAGYRDNVPLVAP